MLLLENKYIYGIHRGDKLIRSLLEKYFIIPNVKVSIFKEFLVDSDLNMIDKIFFIGNVKDFNLIKRKFPNIKMYFIPNENGWKRVDKIRDYKKCYFLSTGKNYWDWIPYFEEKGIEFWNVVPLYDVQDSI